MRANAGRIAQTGQDGRVVESRRRSLDLDLRQDPLQEPWQPPVGSSPRDLHDRQGEAELREFQHLGDQEAAEHRGRDGGRRGAIRAAGPDPGMRLVALR